VRGDARAPRPAVGAAALLGLARRQSLTPLLAALLADTAAHADPLAAALRRDLYRSAARHAALARMAGPLLEALRDAGVPVVVLKGGALAARLYRDPAHRPMLDVDLLVGRADVPALLEAAGRLGLRPLADRHTPEFDLAFDGTLVLAPDGLDRAGPQIDVHWRLLDDWRFAGDSAGWLRRAWERAGPVEYGGAPALALAPEDALLHLAAHLAVQHALDGLLWHCDLALLARRGVDWAAVADEASRLRVVGAVTVALGSTAALLGVRFPAALAPAAMPRRWRLARRLAAGRLTALRSTTHLEHALPLLLMDRAVDAVRAAGRRLLPAPGWIRARYGSGLVGGYARHAGEAVRLAARSLRP